MSSRIFSQLIKHAAQNVIQIDGYVAVDGSSDVVALLPTASTPISGKAYTFLPGASQTLPVHTSTGIYTLTLDESYNALLSASATVSPGKLIVSTGPNNVSDATGGSGNRPGTDPAVARRTVVFKFYNDAGSLADIPVSTGFTVSLKLQKK